MKTLLSTLILISVSLSSAKDIEKSIPNMVNKSTFAVISNVEIASQAIFLSYAGQQFDQCGITLRLSGIQDSQKILDTFDISEGWPQGEELRPAKTGFLSKKRLRGVGALIPNLDEALFGAYFTISTKSGKTIKEEVQNLSSAEHLDVIVSNLNCEEAQAIKEQ